MNRSWPPEKAAAKDFSTSGSRQRREGPYVERHLRMPLHTEDEPATRVLHRLDHAIVGPAGDGQLAGVAHGLVVVGVHLGPLAEHRGGDAAGHEPRRMAAEHTGRRGML